MFVHVATAGGIRHGRTSPGTNTASRNTGRGSHRRLEISSAVSSSPPSRSDAGMVDGYCEYYNVPLAVFEGIWYAPNCYDQGKCGECDHFRQGEGVKNVG